MPSRLPTFIMSRVLWLGLGLGFGLWQLAQGVLSNSPALCLGGLGFSFFGILWFLQPLVVGRNPSFSISSHASLAIGPVSLRIALIAAAFFCIVCGLALRLFATVA